MVKLLQGAVMGAAATAVGIQAVQGVFVRTTGSTQSIASCSVAAYATGAKLTEEFKLFEVAETLASVVCDDHDDGPQAIDLVLTEVATAVAQATTSVVVDCYKAGQAGFTVFGQSYAEFTARSVLKTVASLFASAEVCGQCSSAVQIVTENIQEVVATAVSNNEVSLEATLAAGDVSIHVSAFEDKIVTETVAGAAHFIAEAQANALSGCTIGAQVAAGDPDRADSFVECEIKVNGLFDKVSESKIAAALGAVSVDFCNGPDSDSTDLFAEEVASVSALAIAEVVGACQASDANSAGCARGDAEVEVIANAVATAVAEGVGGIVGNCIPHGCNFQFSDTFMLKDVEEAIVSAAASALADGCTEGTGITDFSAFQADLSTAAVKAIAISVLSVQVNIDKTCGSSGLIGVGAGNSPAPPQPPLPPPVVDPPTVIPPVLLPTPPFPPSPVPANPATAPTPRSSGCANACVAPNQSCSGWGVSGVSPCCDGSDGTVHVCKALSSLSNSGRCRPQAGYLFRGPVLDCTPTAE